MLSLSLAKNISLCIKHCQRSRRAVIGLSFQIGPKVFDFETTLECGPSVPSPNSRSREALPFPRPPDRRSTLGSPSSSWRPRPCSLRAGTPAPSEQNKNQTIDLVHQLNSVDGETYQSLVTGKSLKFVNFLVVVQLIRRQTRNKISVTII